MDDVENPFRLAGTPRDRARQVLNVTARAWQLPARCARAGEVRHRSRSHGSGHSTPLPGQGCLVRAW